MTNLIDAFNSLQTRICKSPTTRELVTSPEFLALKSAISHSAIELRHHTVEGVLGRVETYYGLTREDLIGKDRHQSMVQPRHIAMYLCRQLTKASSTEVGAVFSCDHSNVLHACAKIAAQRADSVSLDGILQELEK
jgi:chromosomal replication initiation ATPase DnaA